MAAKPVYPMSGVGGCPRSVIAQRLSYDTLPDQQFMEAAAEEGNRHEDFIVQDLTNKFGWSIERGGQCDQCDRRGIHVEIEKPAYQLVGHLDGIAQQISPSSEYYGQTFLLEIKALSRFRSEKLGKAFRNPEQFKTQFPAYSVQVSCYSAATNLPILYVVKNRDTGYLHRGVINAPYTIEEIDDYIMGLELAARKDRLAACSYRDGDFERKICPVRYMCAGEDKEDQADQPVGVNQPDVDAELVAAAKLFATGKRLDGQAKIYLEQARSVFLNYLESTGQPSIVVGAVKATYFQPHVEISYPKGALESSLGQETLDKLKKIGMKKGYVKLEEVS